ncbi:LysR family transcriptional regulator [Nocardioides KLBMP 9356]|uniref:LysR family transcriptional regulator n=1 Tax=Nocardioides potassii TaxID=2911371 RepID=A0ABS9HDB6_9ACTN|nr:LysR family transcriptional regulator [Nocardioides potassii]MCF6378111.1 LysR family transcriptional regulator [Nocardioides potassii]
MGTTASNTPELRELRLFVAVAEEGSFTRAAARCFVTQQAMSKTIAALERRVGCELVERRPRGCGLTEAGEQLLTGAYRVLQTVDELTDPGTRNTTLEPRHVLRVGVHDEGLAELTPYVLRAFAQRLPEVAINYRTVPYDELENALNVGSVDVLVCGRAAHRGDGEFVGLFGDPAVVLVSAASDLAEAPTLRAEDIIEQPFVSNEVGLDDTFYGAYTLDGLRGDRAPQLKTGVVRTSGDVTAEIAHHRAVLACGSATTRFAPHPDVVAVPLTDVPAYEVGLATRRRGGLAAEFVECAVKVASRTRDVVPRATPPG